MEEFADASNNNETTAPPGTPVTQFSVFLENRVGALLSIVRLINDAQVEVIGLSVVDSVDVTIVRLVVSDPDAVGTLFMEKGIPFSSTELVAVELDEGSAKLAQCLAVLLEAETNIHFSYPLLTRPDGKAILALCVEDTDFSYSMLRQSGYRVLFQEDLSR